GERAPVCLASTTFSHQRQLFSPRMKAHQAGVQSVVGLMGSALYASQRRALLERFREIILMLDGDPTGRKASVVLSNNYGRTALSG
ncbi:MAG: toprim domain-containing protein, partial [Bryobacterales bacterium]|nr:toprim domain-containing protein [Bryobacterales bacterium]